MRHILVADDHAAVRRRLRALLLEQLGEIEVSEVASGAPALEQAEASTWDLIVLDVAMPRPSIADLVRQIREIEELGTLVEAERRHIVRVIRHEQGSVERAALRLGVARSTLYEKIRKHGIVIRPTGS